ncbi:MAG: glycoside hydrolase family 32 protein [Saprospiraceae bacterium]|nr:glycoside hydrolase family 32 protein [Saprospiraceae bacterium]
MKKILLIILVFTAFYACNEHEENHDEYTHKLSATPKPDYTSKVPFYTFSGILEEQKKELAQNPLLQRFIASRKAQANDPYRPIYHYVNPEGNLNDPNGLCFWQGRWHLFYQAYPPEDPRQHWGHAVSTDLIHWKDLPLAIYPNPEEKCFSGQTLVEKDRVIAAYPGIKYGLVIAVSSDPLLLNWEKLDMNPVDAKTGQPTKRPMGDACIWKDGDYYYELSGGKSGKGVQRKRKLRLHKSKNLIDWEMDIHESFLVNDRYAMVGDDGACPNFWPIGDSHMLLSFSHVTGGNYTLGTYQREEQKLYVTNYGRFNFGGIYEPGAVLAPSATPDGKGGLNVIFNMAYAKPTEGWNQIMTLPRKLQLTPDNVIAMEPTGAIASLRTNHQQIKNVTVPANQEIVLKNIEGNALEIAASIDVKESQSFEINVLRSPDKEEYTKIIFYKNKGIRDYHRYEGWEYEQWIDAKYSLITIDNARSSTLPDVMPNPPESGPFHIPEGELLELRIFIDKSVVEVFANNRQCVAVRVYPAMKESIGVSVRAQGSMAEIKALNAWEMKSIY